MILMKITYIRYSNADTPSYLRALPSDASATFLRENFHQETLKFYLLNSKEFEQENYEIKRAQGASLCRLVTQLKAMAPYYPDQPALEQIIVKEQVHAFGDRPQDNLDTLVRVGPQVHPLTPPPPRPSKY